MTLVSRELRKKRKKEKRHSSTGAGCATRRQITWRQKERRKKFHQMATWPHLGCRNAGMFHFSDSATFLRWPMWLFHIPGHSQLQGGEPPKGRAEKAGGRRQEALLRVVKWWQVLLFLINLDHQDLLQKGKKKKIERKVSRNWEKKEAFTPVSSFSTESCPSLGGTVMVTRTHPSRASSIHAEVP